MTIQPQDPDQLSPREMQERRPSVTAKTEMVLIDGRIWRKGPDGFWYRLDSDRDHER